MSKRAYATLSAIALMGAIVVAILALVVDLPDARLAFAGMSFTALLGLAGTLAGRGIDPISVPTGRAS